MTLFYTTNRFGPSAGRVSRQHFSMDAVTFIDCFMAIPIALYEPFSRGAKGTKGELKKHLWKRANEGRGMKV